MTFSFEKLLDTPTPLWFCLKAQPKHEHLAAAALRKTTGVECFSPRIRFRKSTQRGPVWFNEAMFPTYFFARFVYAESFRQVQSSHGVTGLVRFGSQIAVLEDAAIANLQLNSGHEELIIIDPQPQVGDSVLVSEGAFHGLQAIITQVLPAKERVKILLDFLGRTVEAEISAPSLISTLPARALGLQKVHG